MSKKLNVIIACGGTGGHLFPGVSIAEKLQNRGHNVVALISEKKIDQTAIENHQHIQFETLPSIAFPKLFSLSIIPFFFKYLKAINSAREVIKKNNADIVLGMGGFTSLPALIAGKKEKAYVALHESNSVPGKANLFGQKYVNTAFIGWKEARQFFTKVSDIEVVGTPIRKALANHEDSKSDCIEQIGLDTKKKTILVIGGSQGARSLNQLVGDSLQYLDKESCQFIHLTGPGNETEAQAYYEKSELEGTVAPFFHDMGLLYKACDLVIARSGASTLNELAYFGLPAILVPYPFAAARHQHKNAEVFTNSKAALLADEDEFTGKKLAQLIQDTLQQEKLDQLSKNMTKLAVKNSADLIVDKLEKR